MQRWTKILCTPACSCALLASAMTHVITQVVAQVLMQEVAYADEDALDRARVLSTDAYAPAVAFEYRGGTRARFGVVLPVVDDQDEPGFALHVEPLFELAEPRGSIQFLPSQYWRARAIVEGSYGIIDRHDQYRVFLGIEHESDHETAHAYSQPGMLSLNALAMGLRTSSAASNMRFSTFSTLRLYAISCTVDRVVCRNLGGDVSAGGQFDMVLSFPKLMIGDLEPFSSVSLFAILPHARVIGEAHGEVRLGVWHMTRSILMQVFVTAYAGNDVGITRDERISLVGAGTSFAFVP